MLYNKKLSEEWIAWVEQQHSEGTREQEIFPYICSWLKQFSPQKLVDLGCGQGSCSALVSNHITYVGLDSSPTLIARAKKLYSEANKSFLVGDLYNLPFENLSFDALLSVWVWSHLENLTLAAKEMFRVASPSANCLIITAHPETYEERKSFYSEYSVEGNLLIGTFDLGNNQFLSNTNLYLHTQKEIEDAVLKAGFHIDKIFGMGPAQEQETCLYLVIEASKW